MKTRLFLLVMTPVLYLVLPACAAPTQGGGLTDTELAAKVDAYVAPLIANHDFSGVVLIARGEKILFEKAYGQANYELNVPHTLHSKFQIASLTKTFTAAAIVMLSVEGKLNYKDPLTKYVPDFPNGDRITLLHLLAHQSGVGNVKEQALPTGTVTLEELVDLIKRQPPLFSPGSQSRYSNAGFSLLAYVVQKASGMTYAEYLRCRIFAPLGMHDTGHFPEEKLTPHRVSGYVPGPLPEGICNAPRKDLNFAVGSGSLYSTARDLHRWGIAVQTEKLFKRSSLPYPFGWGRLDRFGSKGVSQTGLINGFTSSLSIYLNRICMLFA